MVDHGLLHGMQCTIGPADSLDGAQGASVQLGQKQDTGIQRLSRAIRIGHHNSAGTAIALVAPFLGRRQTARLAQPVKRRDRGRDICQRHAFPVQTKGDIHVIKPAALPFSCPVLRCLDAA